MVLLCLFAGPALALPVQDEEASPLDLKSIPISDWLNGGEQEQIPWDLRITDPYLRVDQRIEMSYFVRISGRDLNRAGKAHELFFVARVSSPDGEWLQQPNVTRYAIEKELPKSSQAQFLIRLCAQPGDYVLWLVLYDRETGKHNVAKRRVRVPEMRGDPLPDLYRHLPLVEFPQVDESGPDKLGFVKGQLYLPVRNKHALDVELISTLSPPEQWTGRTRVLRTHNADTIGALAALSQIELAAGSMSITGLDLVRHQVQFEQHGLRGASVEEGAKPGSQRKSIGGRQEQWSVFQRIFESKDQHRRKRFESNARHYRGHQFPTVPEGSRSRPATS